jgi:hypothetical protein
VFIEVLLGRCGAVALAQSNLCTEDRKHIVTATESTLGASAEPALRASVGA